MLLCSVILLVLATLGSAASASFLVGNVLHPLLRRRLESSRSWTCCSLVYNVSLLFPQTLDGWHRRRDNLGRGCSGSARL